MYSAFCNSCKLPMKRYSKFKDLEAVWYSTKINNSMIRNETTESEISLISQKLKKYKSTNKRWITFLSYKMDTDRLFHYYDNTENTYGVVILRDKHPVLEFSFTKFIYRLFK